MKDDTSKFLEKAARAIRAAERLREGGDAEFSAGRAYYAMFYVAVALLNEKGLRFSKHSGVHAAFGQHFAKAGKLDAKYHRWLLAAFSKRIADDYGIEAAITLEEADEMIMQAKEFLEAARKYLGGS
jgi:uncharacterized protein (UPF0332 family)